MKTTAEIIKELRVAREWTQIDLACHAGVWNRLVRRAEVGATIDAEHLRAIAVALEVDYDQLFPPSPFPDASNEVGQIRMEILRWALNEPGWRRWRYDDSRESGQRYRFSMTWLERKGLIATKKDPDDGCTLMIITEAGRRFVSGMRPLG